MNYSNEKELFCCYGTLRKGLGNHRLIEGAKYLGDEWLDSKYTMYNVGFPGVIPEGNTPIHIEVYEVSEPSMKAGLDRLEGYHPESHTGMFLREKIETSRGDTWIYFWNYEIDLPTIPDGDYKEHLKRKNIIKEVIN